MSNSVTPSPFGEFGQEHHWRVIRAKIQSVRHDYLRQIMQKKCTQTEDTDFGRLLHVILSHTSVSVADLRKEFDLSRNAALRLYLKDCIEGHSLQSFITYHRIELSKRLLLETQADITTVALSVGYETLEAFLMRFKSKTQMTPRAFREKHGMRDSV